MSTFTNPLKERLKEAGPLYGLWLSMGSETAARRSRTRASTGC